MNEIIRKTIEKCTGCDVCKLPCPVWRQTRDPALTFSGRAKALQGGASPEDLHKSLMACILCGSCGPACPENIDTLETTLYLRAYLMGLGFAPFPAQPLSPGSSHGRIDYALKNYDRRTFLPCEPILENTTILNRIEKLLGNEIPVSIGDGPWTAISSGIRAGFCRSQGLKAQIRQAFRETDELIVSDGLLLQKLRGWLPDVRVMGLGEALIRLPGIHGALRSSDFYIIESTAFHSDYSRLISLYDHVRAETGCRMNLDLQRIAIPTGSSCPQDRYDSNQVDPLEQARWIINESEFKRIVVESMYDLDVFRKITGSPVIHVSELV
ncbi:MAG: (Fe-S)-binding protein [Deltaproteobacteria bacterium]|nr:(Fe-S)-binding protein [Deltaproteobacteria bacterium]